MIVDFHNVRALPNMSLCEPRSICAHHRSVKRRRAKAFSLVELVVGLTGGSLVFLLAIGVVEIAMKLSGDARSQMEHQLAIDRLSTQLRSEIHDATEVSATEIDGQSQVTFKMNNSRAVKYSVDGTIVKRESNGTADQGTAREIFRLAQNHRVRFEVTDQQRVEMTVMRVTSEGEILECRVLAHIGRLAPSRFQTLSN